MATPVEVDSQLASLTLEALAAMEADAAALIDSLKGELQSVAGEIGKAVADDDVELAIERGRLRGELPVRLAAAEVERAKIQTAICDRRIRERTPALEQAAAELQRAEKAAQKSQESRERVFQEWYSLDSQQIEDGRRMRELAGRIRDARGQQVRLLRQGA